ncbi:MAG: polysaccharide pyruvyl transferase family protein [bacterium]|nr:polysaccharide pyruvyl transferase family protein [bacterium]
MKIALITIHYANSYGGVLQAFALGKTLSRYGDVSIIDYKTPYISKTMRPIRLGLKPIDILRTVKDITRLLPRYRLIKKLKSFIKIHLNLTQAYKDSNISEIEKDYDVFVCGSDQIWNPIIVNGTNSIDEIYFLDFVHRKKKFSYAASMGSYHYEGKEIERLVYLLNQFDAISVRELDSCQYLSELLNQPVTHNIDPTLLLPASDWRSLLHIGESKYSKPYILVYAFGKDLQIKKSVEYIAETLKLDVIAINQDVFINYKCKKHIRDASPEEFLNLFANASFIITNSYHGTAFSIIFNSPFVVTGISQTGINRIQNLLNLLDLSERMVYQKEKLPEVLKKQIKYSKINKTLADLRKKSIEYLDIVFNK